MRAGDRASYPAAVKTLVKYSPEDLLSHIGGLVVTSVTEVVGRQQVVIIHDSHEMGCSHPGHFVLFRIQINDFTGIELPNLLEGGGICRIVGAD